MDKWKYELWNNLNLVFVRCLCIAREICFTKYTKIIYFSLDWLFICFVMWALLNDHFDPIKVGFIISVQCLHTKVMWYTDLMATCYFAYTSVWLFKLLFYVFKYVTCIYTCIYIYIFDCIWPFKLLPSLCCPCHLSSSLLLHILIFIKNRKTIMATKLTEFGKLNMTARPSRLRSDWLKFYYVFSSIHKWWNNNIVTLWEC